MSADVIGLSLIYGLIYGIGAIGLSLSLRYLKFPDLTSIGSFTVGGILAIYFVNKYGVFVGLSISALVGGILGLCTAIQITYFNINNILASITTYIASSTISYMYTSGGNIGLTYQLKSFFYKSSFNIGDFLFLLLITFILILLLGLVFSTKFGYKILALKADHLFIKFRHRNKSSLTTFILVLSNFLIAFAGGLMSLKIQTATVTGFIEFLPIVLGSIFGSHSFFYWISYLAAKKVSTGNPEHSINLMESFFLRNFYTETPVSIGFYLFGIASFATVLTIISSVISNTAKIKGIEIPIESHFIINAIIIFLLLWSSSRKNNEEDAIF